MKRQTARCKACEQCSQHPNGPSKSGGPWQRRLDGRWHRESSLCQEFVRSQDKSIGRSYGSRETGSWRCFGFFSRLAPGTYRAGVHLYGAIELKRRRRGRRATSSHVRTLMVLCLLLPEQFLEREHSAGFGIGCQLLPADSHAASAPSTRSARAKWPK